MNKLLRGDSGTAVRALIGLSDAPVAILDARGKLLVGEDPGPEAPAEPIQVDEQLLGEVRGAGQAAEAVTVLLRHLCSRELEKVQLANETLGRYKELTLLYDMSDRLSRMLEADDVASSVVQEAKRAVSGNEATLFLHDQRTDQLVALASTREGRQAPLEARTGVEGRVLRTGQAEFVEEVDSSIRGTMDDLVVSVICAPIRSGERVAGVLRVANTTPGAWGSGDLKLVTSLAAQAAAALQGAELHKNRMRSVALKHHLRRYVSPILLDAVLAGAERSRPGTLALVFCDLVGSEGGDDPGDLVTSMEGRTTRAVDVLLRHGAVVDIPQGAMILAAFHAPQAADVADRATSAALELARALSSDPTDGEVPGVGITSADLGASDRDAIGEALNAAALLQAASGGRILVDYDVATALGGKHNPTEVQGVELPGARTKVFEVRP